MQASISSFAVSRRAPKASSERNGAVEARREPSEIGLGARNLISDRHLPSPSDP